MHHYRFHIKDYVQATAHLSPDEDLAYRRMIDLYMIEEAPLTLDVSVIARRVRCAVDVVAVVLSEFFIREDDGWHNNRCDKTIDEYAGLISNNRIAGKRSAEIRAKKALQNKGGSTSVERVLNECATNHKPVTSKPPLPPLQEIADALPAEPSKKSTPRLKSVASGGETGAKSDSSTTTKKPRPLNPDWEDMAAFVTAYPPVKGVKAAPSKAIHKFWLQESPPLTEVLSAVAWFMESDQWQEAGGRYIPSPITFLQRRMWESVGDSGRQQVAFI